MPKERRDRSVSFDRLSGQFPCSPDHGCITSPKEPLETDENLKEWEEARCPVCMEHPHNAVLLMCSSHEKGCRPYMCDTSYRHSNCLDQFQKSFAETSSGRPHAEDADAGTTESSTVTLSDSTIIDFPGERNEEGLSTHSNITCENQLQAKLLCPLCRGQIKGWVVVESARHFMNAKLRSCSCETCSFSGTYKDLRKHARLEHPAVRPSEADPERQRNWRRLERQRDIGDLLSTLQSSFGEERGEDSVLPIEDGSWLTVFFLIRVFRPGSSPRSSSWSGSSRARGQLGVRRRSARLWGESYDGETRTSGDEENETSDGEPYTWRRRVQRRTTPENQ